MGSNIRLIQDQTPAWRPPNGAWKGVEEWWTRLNQNNKSRQNQLTPDKCEVDPTGLIELSPTTYTLDEAEARKRGWGEVYWAGYGPVLMELERELNDQYTDAGKLHAQIMQVWEHAQNAAQIQSWQPTQGQPKPLTPADFDNIGEYYFPVWACGYNWLQSNEESAQVLLKRIQQVFVYSIPDH